MKIKTSTIENIRQLPVSDILRKENVRLKKVGREYLAKCPWHLDTNPSLTINDEKGLCFCFVCKGGSDGISYIQQKFGLSFSEAVERIALSNGIEFETEDSDPEAAKRDRQRRLQFESAITKEHQSYRDAIRSHEGMNVRQLLLDRGILPETAKEFEIGYAKSGFFANRLTIPIHNHLGSLVGFTARSIEADQMPKYKNSANSEYFDKSKILFNEYRALQSIRESDSVIFVEGHFDAISMWQAGIKNVVAMQGTAVIDMDVINRLARRTKRFILCFDSDDGGNKAVENFVKAAGPMACRGELTISVVQLPSGMDPDDCIRSDDCDLYQLITSAPSWLDWQLDVWLSGVDRSDTKRFSEIESAIRRLIESIQSPALRRYYIDKASKILVPDIKGANKLAIEWSDSLSKVSVNRVWQKPDANETRLKAERRLVRLYLHAPELRDYCRPLFEKIHSPALRWLCKRIDELEAFSANPISASELMAILLVAEPHYTTQLRPIAVPTIKIDKSSGVLRHIEDILCSEIVTVSHEVGGNEGG